MGLHEEVTKRIITQLEAGTAPWVKSWAVPLPYNAASNRRYNGVNVLLLWNTPYSRPAWLTYRQARELGGQVRRGEASTTIVYVAKKAHAVADEGERDERKPKVIPLLCRYFVFNVEQVDGLPKHLYAPPLTLEPNMEAFFSGVGADVRWGPIPLYNPREDYIQLPHPEHFESLEQYYATRLHETVHWTGHTSRLDRQFGKRFGDHAYAFEELVAELGSAFLSADLGLKPELGHQARYIGDWIEILSNDRQAIFMAAARATYAAEYVKRLASPESHPEKSETAHA
jgi:antirestriction protein ArdC